MGSFLKNQEPICRDLQYLRNGKQGIQRDGLVDVRRFHMTDECRCPFNTLRQFFLWLTLKRRFSSRAGCALHETTRKQMNGQNGKHHGTEQQLSAVPSP